MILFQIMAYVKEGVFTALRKVKGMFQWLILAHLDKSILGNYTIPGTLKTIQSLKLSNLCSMMNMEKIRTSTVACTEQCTMWIYQDITLASSSSSGGYHLWVDHRGQVAWYTPGVWEALVFGQLDHWSIPSQYIRSWYWFVRKWRVTLWDTRSFIEV